MTFHNLGFKKIKLKVGEKMDMKKYPSNLIDISFSILKSKNICERKEFDEKFNE